MKTEAITEKNEPKVNPKVRMKALMNAFADMSFPELEGYKAKLIQGWVDTYGLPEEEVENFITVDLIMQQKISAPVPKQGLTYSASGKKNILPPDHGKPKAFKD